MSENKTNVEKIASNVLLIAAGRLTSAFGVPLALALMYWAASSFIDIRDAVRDLKAIIQVNIADQKRIDAVQDFRIEQLEKGK